MQSEQSKTQADPPFHEVKLIVNGQELDAEGDVVFTRLQPNTEIIATQAASASIDDAIKTANAAAAAFPQWSQTSADTRSAILLKTADLIEANEEAFVEAMTAETGGTKTWARFNCSLAADVFRHAATLANYETEATRAGRDEDVTSTLVRQPVGVVLSIAPWNAPIVLASRAVAIPLACGNTVVLKASEVCPKTHAMVVKILHDAGLPPGAVNLVTNAPETAEEVVEALVGHSAVRRINFTGSTRVGRMVAQTCARYLKPVVLELSGKAPLIVLKDADIEEAVKAAAFGAFFNQGQICISTERVIVDHAIAEEFTAKLAVKAKSLIAGDPAMGDFPLGLMISTTAVSRVKALVDDAVEKGAKLLTGNSASATMMQPVVLDGVYSSMRIYREESFGPVAAIIRCSGEDEAISIANDTSFGLAAAIFSSDVENAHLLALRLESGICHINGPTLYDDPAMPFGGMKDSGYGRLGGKEAVLEFTEQKWISAHKSPIDYPI